jgi:hypothetical protein
MDGSEDEKSPDTLGEALPREMARVRDEVLPRYLAIGLPGVFGASRMRAALDAAAKALAEEDVVKMIQVYEVLKGFTD